MNRELPILAKAKLVRRLGQKHWQAEYPNGAVCIAHLPEQEKNLLNTQDKHTKLDQATPAILEVSPYDLSRGRIIAFGDALD